MMKDFSYEYRVKAASIILGEQPAAENVLTEVYELPNGISGLTIKQLILILIESEEELDRYWV